MRVSPIELLPLLVHWFVSTRKFCSRGGSLMLMTKSYLLREREREREECSKKVL